MPVAVHINPRNMSKDDYKRVMADLDASGASKPDGRVFHAAYGDNVQIFEVWDSLEQFKTHKERLFTAINAATGYEVDPLVEAHAIHEQHPD